MAHPKLILASASPRRVDLLATLGLVPIVRPSGIPEQFHPGETPIGHARRLAEEKAARVASEWDDGDALVLGADTLVTLDARVLGKPIDETNAKEMLRFLAGREHEVVTGVALVRSDGGRATSETATTRVRFRPLPERVIDWYVRSGEPLDKAGAYSIQGLGVLLSDGIDGSWSNVVGLPLEILPALFARVGIDLLDLSREPPAT